MKNIGFVALSLLGSFWVSDLYAAEQSPSGASNVPQVIDNTLSPTGTAAPTANPTPASTTPDGTATPTAKAKPAKVEERNLSKDDLLYRVNLGRADDIALILQDDTSISNSVNDIGVPLLCLAAARTDSEAVKVVKLLVESGADVNKIDKKGQHSLFYAAKSGNEEVVNYLLSQNIKATAVDISGDAPRDVASKLGKTNIVAMIDSYVAKTRKDEIQKEYDKANKKIEEQFEEYKKAHEATKDEAEELKKLKEEKAKLEAENKKKTEVAKTRAACAELDTQSAALTEGLGKVVNDLSFSSCALAYWQYAKINQMPTEFNRQDLDLNIQKKKENIVEYGNSYVNDYSGNQVLAQRIVNISTNQTNQQLDNITSAASWKKNKMGTLTDMNERCHQMADIWQAAIVH